MNDLRRAADEYLALRRALGFKFRGHDRLLADFLDHLERSGTTTITVATAVAWATALADVTPIRWANGSAWCGVSLAMPAASTPPPRSPRTTYWPFAVNARRRSCSPRPTSPTWSGPRPG